MTIISICLAILSGIVISICYRVFFLLQRRRLFSFAMESTQIKQNPSLYKRAIAHSLFFSALRIIFIVIVFRYLLLSMPNHFIIVTLSFFITWLLFLFIDTRAYSDIKK